MIVLSFFKSRLQSADCVLNCAYRKQLLAALTVNIISLAHGVALGWAAPTIARISSADTPLPFTVSVSEASWIGSLMALGSVTANIFFGAVLNVVGRKYCLYFLALPHMAFWVFIYLAKSVVYLYIGRYFAGFPGGGGSIVIQIYVSEIADARIRGSLTSFFMFSMNIGVLVGYAMSSYVDYYLFPILAMILPLLFVCTAFMLPDTPQYLLRKKKCDEAQRSYLFYKNSNEATKESCLKEFNDLQTSITKVADNKTGVTWRDFVERPVLRIHCTALVLLLLNQFSGLFAFINYMSTVFETSGSALPPNVSTIVIGLVQILGLLVTTLFIDTFGRKLLLSVSSCGVSLGLMLFGVYTYLAQSLNFSTDYHVIPLVLMCFIIFIGNIGVVAFTGLMILEIYPVKIRSIAFSACLTLYSLINFFTLKVFLIFMNHFGISLTMWCCSGITLVCFLYLLYFLPETKGKSLDVE